MNSKKSWGIAALVVAASAIAGGFLGSPVSANARTDKLNQLYQVYTAAYAAVEQQYVEPMDDAAAAAAVYGKRTYCRKRYSSSR